MLKLLVQTQKNMLPVGIEIPRSMQGRLTRVLFINIYITNILLLYCAVSSFLAFCAFSHLFSLILQFIIGFAELCRDSA